MNAATKIRAAYLRLHEQDQFNLNLAGNVRPLLNDPQTSNTKLYSGDSVSLIGGATAYWKAEDGYFFVCGSLDEVGYVYKSLLHSFELFGFVTKDGQDVVTMREVPQEPAPKRATLKDYEAAGNARLWLDADHDR